MASFLAILSSHALYLRGFYSFPLKEASWLITLLSSSYVLDCGPFLSLDTVELWTVVLMLSLPYPQHLHTKAPPGTVPGSGIPDLRKGTSAAHIRITSSVFQSSSRFKDRPSVGGYSRPHQHLVVAAFFILILSAS